MSQRKIRHFEVPTALLKRYLYFALLSAVLATAGLGGVYYAIIKWSSGSGWWQLGWLGIVALGLAYGVAQDLVFRHYANWLKQNATPPDLKIVR